MLKFLETKKIFSKNLHENSFELIRYWSIIKNILQK